MDSDLDVEEDTRSSNEFLADLNVEFHDKALLANQKRFYKRSGRVGSAKKPMDKSNEICFACGKLLSSEDEGTTRVNTFMAIAEDEPSVGKAYARSGGRGKRKDAVSPKEVLFTKAYESPSKTALEITSDFKSKCDNQDPLPPLSKLSRAELIGKSNDVIPLADLTLTSAVPKKTIQVTDKMSSVNVTKKRFRPMVKGLKEQIKTPSDNSTSVLQTRSSKFAKGKQKTRFGPCKHCRYRNHLLEDCYIKPKCSTCGSSDHLTKEHPEQAIVKKTLAKLKAQSSQGSSSRKAPMIPKPYIDYNWGFNDHHSDEYKYYPGCDIYGSIAHETADCVKKPSPNNRKPRIANRGCSRHMIGVKQYMHIYSKESGLKVVFGDNSSGDTEGYGSVNCNGITFTRELRSDNGTEFENHKLEEFCNEKGISQNFSSPCTPEQNGVDERRNKTLIEAARTMLNSANLPKQFWGEAVNTACYTQNRSIIIKRHGKTSYDVFRGRSPDIISLHVFGCPMHIHTQRPPGKV
ncbi:retrovirus-related pol polyprotein from transposon TNT 1-94 [Tanacetum coccineum]